MQTYFTFVQHHWELWLTFGILLFILIAMELRAKLSGLAQVTPQQATLLINHENALILDIREAKLFSLGHILNAVNIPAAELDKNVKKLETYKDRPVIIVHASTQPPHQAGVLLEDLGFTKISNLSGGMQSWQNANMPIVKG